MILVSANSAASITLDGIDGLTTSTSFITALGLAIGTTASLSTEKLLARSGIGAVDPTSLLVARRIGVTVLGYSIAASCVVFFGTSGYTAVALSSLFPAIELYKTLFDGTQIDLGFPSEGQVLLLFVNIFFLVGLLVDDESSFLSKDTVLRIHSGWFLLNGTVLGFFPKPACQAWGLSDVSDVLRKFVSVHGFNIGALGILSACLSAGMDATKAITYGGIALVSSLAAGK